MLIKGFNLLDIKKYEQTNRVNILSFFDGISIDHMLDLISLGNGGCNKEESAQILDNYLADGGDIVSGILEIKEALLGKGENKEEDSSDESLIDIKKYESLTDLYISYSMQLMSVGLGYSEFWSMDTRELFKVFNSITIKMQNETNRELSNYHTLAAMIGGAVWGKLQKEPPRVNYAEQEQAKNMDDEARVNMARLKAFASSYNNSLKNKKEAEE